jgi:hypothetical protein
MTLTEVVRLTKIGSVLAVFLLLISLILPSSLAAIKSTLFPPKTPPPEVAFGKLPSLKLSGLPIKEGITPEYVLDTKTGRLPKDLPDRLKVYKVVLPAPSPLAAEKAKELASKLGFSGEPEKRSSREFMWKNNSEKRQLNMDITTGNFELKTEPQSLGDLPRGSSPSKAAAIEQAKNFLQSLGILSVDYLEGRKESAYLAVDGGELKKVSSLSEAQLTRVDFYREINDQPILTPNPYEGLVNVILSKDGPQAVTFHSWPLDAEQSSTYPLKTAAGMWELAKNGRARIVFLGPLKGDPYASYTPQAPQTIFVREIYLAYFDAEKYQDYLQPIFVLEGLAVTPEKRQLKFIAYLPAISSDWIEEADTP